MKISTIARARRSRPHVQARARRRRDPRGELDRIGTTSATRGSRTSRSLVELLSSHRDSELAELTAQLAIDSLIKLQKLDQMLQLADQLAADARFLAGKPQLKRTLDHVRSRSMRR